jgi:hypothetical protein
MKRTTIKLDGFKPAEVLIRISHSCAEFIKVISNEDSHDSGSVLKELIVNGLLLSIDCLTCLDALNHVQIECCRVQRDQRDSAAGPVHWLHRLVLLWLRRRNRQRRRRGWLWLLVLGDGSRRCCLAAAGRGRRL